MSRFTGTARKPKVLRASLSDGRRCHGNFVADLEAKTQDNIYFCISHQSLNNGHRDRENAVGAGLYADGHGRQAGQPTSTTARIAEAIVAACSSSAIQVGIPRPALLSE